MTLILLKILSRSRFGIQKSKLIHLFLILIAMLICNTATPQVTADFTTISSSTGCGSLVVEFKDLSTGTPTSWLWDFGNGNTSNLKDPSAIYTNPGFYDVSLTVSDLTSNNTKTTCETKIH